MTEHTFYIKIKERVAGFRGTMTESEKDAETKIHEKARNQKNSPRSQLSICL